MAEPTSSYTLQDLILRVARAAAVAYYGSDGQGRAMVPIDEDSFQRCLDCVNDGIKMFIASAPPEGWRWMNRDAEVLFYPDGDGDDNISSDAARYLLPEDFQGEIAGPITYEADSGRGRIEWVGEAEIRRRRELSVTTAYPSAAAVKPSPTARRWELIVDPAPGSADTVTFPYRAGFAAMQAVVGTASGGSATTLVDDTIAGRYADDYFNDWTIQVLDGTGRNAYATVTDYTGASGTFTAADWLGGVADPAANSTYFVCDSDKHPAGMQFDEAILAACLAKAEMEFEDLKLGHMNKFLEKDLPEAWRIDARSAPRKLGVMLPGTRRTGYERIWNTVTKV